MQSKIAALTQNSPISSSGKHPTSRDQLRQQKCRRRRQPADYHRLRRTAKGMSSSESSLDVPKDSQRHQRHNGGKYQSPGCVPRENDVRQQRNKSSRNVGSGNG